MKSTPTSPKPTPTKTTPAKPTAEPEPQPQPKVSRWSRVFFSVPLRLLGAAIGIFVWSFFLVWFLQCSYAEGSVVAGWEFIGTYPSVFWYSVLIVALWLILLTAVLRSVFQAGGFTWALLIIAAFANSAKLAARDIPLLPEDLGLIGEAGSLMQFVDTWDLVRVILTVILVVAISCYAGVKIRRAYRRVQTNSHRFINIILRLVVVGLSFYALILTTEPIRRHDGSRYYEVSWLNTTFTAWNSATTYKKNGFILGYLYNLEKYRLTAPADYSADTIEATVAKYAALKTADDPTRTPLADTDYNIVVILNESFYDLATLSDFYTFTDRTTGAVVDLTPNLHRLQASYLHGQMFTVDIGGGTANVEFEALTGLTNYWTNTVPYTDLISSLKTLPSVASWARSGGLNTVAMHSFNGGMYKRNLVYPIMGFNEFLDLNILSDLTYNASSHYVDDGSLYAAALTQLADHDERQLVSLVTMQNHTSYDKIPESDLRYHLATGASNPYNQYLLEGYAQTLQESDAYLGEFIANLEALDEPTVVLFYGDHAPGIFDVVVDSDQPTRAYQTPYLIWANFDLPDVTANNGPVNTSSGSTGAAANHTEDGTALPTVSPNCLLGELYDVLQVQKPAYFYLVDAVCSEVPVLTHTAGQDDAIEATYATSEPLRAYQMATYDLLGGKQYWIEFGGFE